MSFPVLIGITGKAGSGKDTLAEYLQIVFGYHRYALLAPIIEKLIGTRERDFKVNV
jgi:broad-specificity NMP kinase